MRRCDDQVALALAIFVVGHHDDLAVGKSLQNFGNGMGHETCSRNSMKTIWRRAWGDATTVREACHAPE